MLRSLIPITALFFADVSALCQPNYDFATNGVQSAKVIQQNGVPTLLINGQAVPPLLFQYQGFRSDPLLYWTPQTQKAASHGVHLYKILLTAFPWDHGTNGVPMNYAYVDERINSYLQADPKAVFLLSLGVWPNTDWNPSVAPTNADKVTTYNGTVLSDQPSIGSDIYFNGFLTSAQKLLQHLESSSLASHILGYVIMGQNTGEWFPIYYTDNGPDYSASNVAGFRNWLTSKYGNNANLSAAWGSAATLGAAQIPLIDPRRLPLGSYPPIGSPIVSFYQTPGEQNWIDFSQYTSDIFSQRILDIAAMFRAATASKRLIGFYNGYSFDLAASYNGHLRIDRLLASPNIDLICSPISYIINADRMSGGPAAAMSARDSIAAHGKIQIAEDDLRTDIGQAAGLPDLGYNGTVVTSGFDENMGILKRNFASAMVHRGGTWWLDLNENGAFNDDRLWQVMTDGLAHYGKLLNAPKPYKPEVALIVDPASIAYESNDYTLTIGTRASLRNALGRTGVSYGVYLLDDFINGMMPPCKIYIFANLWYLTDAQITAIQNRLNSEGAVAIWQYAPGYLGPSGPDENRISRLIGITVKRMDGGSGSGGAGVMGGLGWGWPYNNSTISPRFVVNDSAATVIGNYFSTSLVSSAQKKVGNFTSIFFGDFGLVGFVPVSGAFSGDILRPILRSAGARIWTDNGEIVHTDGSFLAINSLPAASVRVHLPPGVTASSLDGAAVTVSGDGIDVNFNQHETHYFSLIATPITAAYSISGQLTKGGVALSGVTMTLTGGPGGARISDASGNYSFTGLPAGVNYALTPSLANTSFTPSSAVINNLASNAIANFTGGVKPGTGLPDKVGATYSGYSVLDANGNFAWDGAPIDKVISWSTFQAGEKPIYGDWNGDGKTKVGVYNNGTWLLDYNGNGVWDGLTIDRAIFWSTGQSADVPVLGDWNGDGRTKIGVYTNGAWILDYNGNGVWEGPGVDRTIYWSTGQAGEVPVVGDWNGDGRGKIGVYVNGTWILEYNGNYAWDGTGIDKLIYFGGPGYSPMVGDWNGSGWTKIGAYHVNGTWALDYNGNFVWDGTAIDRLTFFGGPAWTPVVGDWNGSGASKIGAYTGGQWALDVNGNFAWDPPPDRLFSFGAPGQTPIVGKW